MHDQENKGRNARNCRDFSTFGKIGNRIAHLDASPYTEKKAKDMPAAQFIDIAGLKELSVRSESQFIDSGI